MSLQHLEAALCCMCLSLQGEGGWSCLPGKAVLHLLCAAVKAVEGSFCKASVHWWEVQQVRRGLCQLHICAAPPVHVVAVTVGGCAAVLLSNQYPPSIVRVKCAACLHGA
jgi:NMD protein affecting ribosome stability and mRNA decay